MRVMIAAAVRLLFVGLLALSAIQSGFAETRYVHDRVEVGVFENADLTGDTLAIVTTGTPLEVLERTEEQAKVRIPSGGIGWIDASYLTADEPAAVLLLEFEAENQRLAQALEETRRRLRQVGEQPGPGEADPPREPGWDRVLQARIERAIAVLQGGEPSEPGNEPASEPRAERVIAALAGLPLWMAGVSAAAILLLGLGIGHWWGVRSRASLRGGIRVQVHR